MVKPQFTVVAYIALRAVTREEAEAATKAIYAGIWDLIPELPEPEVAALMFDTKGPVHRIERTKIIPTPLPEARQLKIKRDVEKRERRRK